MSLLVKKLSAPTQFYPTDLKLIENENLSVEAKMVYIYVASRPPGWEIYVKDIQKRQNLSPKRVTKALKELQQIGLLEITQARDPETNQFTNKVWHLLGGDVLKSAYNKVMGRDVENQITGKPNYGKQPPNYNQEKLDQIKKQPTGVVDFKKIKEDKHRTLKPVQEVLEPKLALGTQKGDLVGLMTSQGMLRNVAEILAEEFSAEVIKNQVAWLPYRKCEEPGAFLKSAIQNNYSPPREILAQQEAAEKREKLEKEKEAQIKARSVFQVGQKLKTPSGKIAQIRMIMGNAIECIADGIAASIPFEQALTWERI